MTCLGIDSGVRDAPMSEGVQSKEVGPKLEEIKCAAREVDAPMISVETSVVELATRHETDKGVVANHDGASTAEVAGGSHLDSPPFWLLLKQVCYTYW